MIYLCVPLAFRMHTFKPFCWKILHYLWSRVWKSSGVDYWRHTHNYTEEMVFSSCKADPDVWIQPVFNSNGIEYYQCVLNCTDYVLSIVEEPELFFVKISKTIHFEVEVDRLSGTMSCGTKCRKLHLKMVLNFVVLFNLNILKLLLRM